MMKGCFYFHFSSKLDQTCLWRSSVSSSIGQQFINSWVKGRKIRALFCLHKTTTAHLLFHSLVSSCMHDVCWLSCGHGVVDMSFDVAYETMHVCQPKCTVGPGPLLWPSVGVCVPHVPPVQWFTVSVLGHMTVNRWHSGVPPQPPTHTLKTHTSTCT